MPQHTALSDMLARPRRADRAEEPTTAELAAFRRMVQALRSGRVYQGRFKLNKQGVLVYAEETFYSEV